MGPWTFPQSGGSTTPPRSPRSGDRPRGFSLSRRLVMRAEAARVLRVPPTRIGQWVNDGAPVARAGRRGLPALYDVAALRRWRRGRENANHSTVSLEVARARLAK